MPEPTSDAWAQIRYDYEHTDRPVEDICAEHGISSGTLRDRMRRWNWTRRRMAIPPEGPPPVLMPRMEPAPPAFPAAPQVEAAASVPSALPPAPGEDAGLAGDDEPGSLGPRLQNALARVLPAIEATLATLGGGQAHPREMERAARVLAALTRTLRELNTLLRERPVSPAVSLVADEDMPEDIDAFRLELVRKIDALLDEDGGGGEREQA